MLIDQVDKLRNSFHKIRSLYFFEIDGVVILPGHFHLMITLQEDDGDFSLRLRLIKGAFSHQIAFNEYANPSRGKKRERGIWQRRFWEHVIRDERDYEHHLNYIHYNPVKHGYVKKASDWPYSSIHRWIRAGVLPENWAHGPDLGDGVFGE